MFGVVAPREFPPLSVVAGEYTELIEYAARLAVFADHTDSRVLTAGDATNEIMRVAIRVGLDNGDWDYYMNAIRLCNIIEPHVTHVVQRIAHIERAKHGRVPEDYGQLSI